jgi:hypothetical protein
MAESNRRLPLLDSILQARAKVFRPGISDCLRLLSSSITSIPPDVLDDDAGFGTGMRSDVHSGVSDNTFIDINAAAETYSPLRPQAYDYCEDDWWISTNGYCNYRSYWMSPDLDTDGEVDEPCVVGASAGAENHCRLATPSVPMPEFVVRLVIMAVLTATFITAEVRRRTVQLS